MGEKKYLGIDVNLDLAHCNLELPLMDADDQTSP